MDKLSEEQLQRYARQIILPGFGGEGQKRLRRASALVVGVGGLGSAAALYLAAAGLGRLGLADSDTVQLSDLQRQVLYTTADLGRPKLAVAAARLAALNPDVCVRQHPERLTAQNARALIAEYDLVLDCSDNFPTRYLTNDICALLGKPNIYGSVFRFEGQLSVFHPSAGGPCYRCLYPEPPGPDVVPSCAQAGIIGVLPGVIGTLQASEALKLILGLGQPLIGRLFLFDALEGSFRVVTISKNENCPLCGANPTISQPKAYEQFPAQGGSATSESEANNDDQG